MNYNNKIMLHDVAGSIARRSTRQHLKKYTRIANDNLYQVWVDAVNLVAKSAQRYEKCDL